MVAKGVANIGVELESGRIVLTAGVVIGAVSRITVTEVGSNVDEPLTVGWNKSFWQADNESKLTHMLTTTINKYVTVFIPLISFTVNSKAAVFLCSFMVGVFFPPCFPRFNQQAPQAARAPRSTALHSHEAP